MLRVVRHRLGIRVYLFRRRIHEWHLGFGVLIGDVVAVTLHALSPASALGIATIGIWLVAKDWPDLAPSTRDTTAWRLGLHRKPLRLRPSRRLDDVPAVAAFAVAVVAIVDLVSAATPNVSWRGHVLVHIEPVAVMRGAHALAVPVSFALLITAYYLYRRRSRAFRMALTLMAALTAFNLVKGLDFEEAALTAAAGALLWASRSSFYVRHAPATLRSAAWRLPLLLAGVSLVTLAAVALAAPASASATEIIRATGDLLLWQRAPFKFHDELAQTGLAVELTGLLALLAAAYLVFRPLAAPRDLPDPELRRAAAKLVREHGADTLSFFKLRADKQYLFNPEKTAFVGYRIEGRVLMISGDPIGDEREVENLLPVLVRFAEERALRLAALGVSPSARGLFEQAGLRPLYMGDEAIVDTERFSLEGRPIRKVRQSVSRLRKAGYRTAVAELGSLDVEIIERLEQIANDWRRGAPERGFSMAMDSLRNPQGEKTLVVYATDDQGAIRAFLHFVPTYGRDAVSLSFMRREHETPNGLTEFLIVEAIEHLRARGIAEASLNFAAFARLLREPSGIGERMLARALTLGDTWFQIKRLYRFNAKFFPRWEPRYLMYEHRFGLPRAGIAALWLEGQLPKPKIRRRRQAARA
jgi:lysyl-tRNA synthetase class 2